MKLYYFDPTREDVIGLDKENLHIDGNKVYPLKDGFYFDTFGWGYLNLAYDPIGVDKAAIYERAIEWAEGEQDRISAEMNKLQLRLEQLEMKEKYFRKSREFHILNEGGQLDANAQPPRMPEENPADLF